jgi:pimeloyl-ACP methyl ester carboxylesterase
VLLVHGWEGRGAQLGALVDPLVAAGYQAIALDGPAHGDSPGRSTTGPEFAAAMLAVRDSVGSLAAVVGHSFGGFASLLAVARGLETERLVTIAAPSSVPEILQDFTRMIRLAPRAQPPMVRALERRVQAPMESFDVTAFAERVRIPVLVVHDTDDLEVSYTHAARLGHALHGRVLTTSGLGHRRVLFAPEVVNAVVQFVEEGRASQAVVPSAEARA